MLFFGLGAGAAWVATHRALLPGLLGVLPWVLGGAVALKAGVAGWAFRTATRRGLLTGRAVAGAAAAWLGFFGAVLALGVLLMGDGSGLPAAISPAIVPLGAALFAPLARFGLAPLAVDAARHR